MLERGWKYHPSLRFLLAFAAGIVTATLAPTDSRIPVLLIMPLLPLLGMRGTRTPAGLVAAFLSAMMMAQQALATRRPFLPVDGLRCEVFGTIIASVEARDRPWRTDAVIDSARYRGRCVRLTGRCRVVSRDSAGPTLAIGDVVALQGYLHTVEVTGRLPAHDRFSLYLDRGDDTRTVRSAREIQCMFESIRSRVRSILRTSIGGREGGIARALILGERIDLDSDLRGSFQATGTIHVLALSGLHIGLIAVGLSLVTTRLRRQWTAITFLIVFFGAYILLVGASPPIVRATIMAVVGLLSRYAGRRTRSINTLAVASLMILILEPLALFDISFLLSCSAVAGVLVIAPALARSIRIRRLSRMTPIAQGMAVSIGAQVGTLPVSMTTFGVFPVLSAPANVVVVPLIAWSMAGTISGLLIEPIAASVSEPLFSAARIGFALCVHLTEAIARLSGPWTVTYLIQGPGGVALAVSIVAMILARRIAARALAALAASATLAFGHVGPADVESGSIRFVPVGRGGAVLSRVHSVTRIHFDHRIVGAERVAALIKNGFQTGDSLELVDIADVGAVRMGGGKSIIVTVAPGIPGRIAPGRTEYLVIPLRQTSPIACRIE